MEKKGEKEGKIFETAGKNAEVDFTSSIFRRGNPGMIMASGVFTEMFPAPYDFLHDITCLMKKPFSSPYRQLTVTRFWHTLKSLGQSDQLLVHLNTFLALSANVIPESIRSGMPLFYLPAGAPGCPPVLASK